MKIYGVSVVQDEADVIRESVEWALRFCDRIWIWDLGSRDGTWEFLQGLRSARVHVERREKLSYASSLRGEVFKAYREQIEDGSWVYILDADEFLVGDPRPVLAAAEAEGAGMVGVWQANFFPTERDLEALDRLGEEAWCRIPLAERLRYYRVEWFEWRFTRVVPGMVWDTSGPYNAIRLPHGETLKHSRHRMVVRHYRHRSPQQVARRHALRRAAAESVPRFRYEHTGDFRMLARPSARCRYWPAGEVELRVPAWELWRARAWAIGVRLRRRWQKMCGEAAPQPHGELPVFNFLVPASSDEELADLSRADVDKDWRLFRMGECSWSLQTYLLLKDRGLPVTCSRAFRTGCVNIGHIAYLDRLGPDPEVFVVAIRADHAALPWAQMHVVQNKKQARSARYVWIPHWPQPGLVGRDPARRGVKTAAYVGRSWMQAGTPEQWAEALRPWGVQFRLIDQEWNDLSQVDVLVAIRSFDGCTYPNKPPTKLLNAWLAGIPLVAGCDSAFAQIGTPGEDYLVARTLEEAVAAIRRLKEDPGLYERIVERGRRKVEAFVRDRIADMWLDFLSREVAPRFRAWGRRGAGWRLAYGVRVGWYRVQCAMHSAARGLRGRRRES